MKMPNIKIVHVSEADDAIRMITDAIRDSIGDEIKKKDRLLKHGDNVTLACREFVAAICKSADENQMDRKISMEAAASSFITMVFRAHDDFDKFDVEKKDFFYKDTEE